MAQAMDKLYSSKKLPSYPINDFLAATSVGILTDKQAVVDLNYIEDSSAEVDMNVVMTGSGEFVELQGTGEEATFSYGQLQEMLGAAQEGISELLELQKSALGENISGSIQSKREKLAGGHNMQEVIIATKNAGKAREFERMFKPLGYQVKTLLDYPDFQDVEETGSTFEENAILKAEAVSKAFGRMVIADDSGLIIDALGGSRASIPPAMQARKKRSEKYGKSSR